MINVDITREKFNDPVDLKFSGLPDGVIIMEKDLAISKQKEILNQCGRTWHTNPKRER